MAQEKWLVDGPKTIDVENVRKLKVSLISGQVDIVGHDEPGVRVEVHSVSGRDLKVAVEGDTLEVDHPQLSWDNWLDVFKSFRGNARADVSIMVPRDVGLKFGVVNAEALVSGIHDGRVDQHRQRRPGHRQRDRRHPAQLRQRRDLGAQPHRPHRRPHGQRRHHGVGRDRRA